MRVGDSQRGGKLAAGLSDKRSPACCHTAARTDNVLCVLKPNQRILNVSIIKTDGGYLHPPCTLHRNITKSLIKMVNLGLYWGKGGGGSSNEKRGQEASLIDRLPKVPFLTLFLFLIY